MSKVENLEQPFYPFQVGNKVQDLEIYTLHTFQRHFYLLPVPEGDTQWTFYNPDLPNNTDLDTLGNTLPGDPEIERAYQLGFSEYLSGNWQINQEGQFLPDTISYRYNSYFRGQFEARDFIQNLPSQIYLPNSTSTSSTLPESDTDSLPDLPPSPILSSPDPIPSFEYGEFEV